MDANSRSPLRGSGALAGTLARTLVQAPLLPVAAVLLAALGVSGRGAEPHPVFDPERPVAAEVVVPAIGARAWRRDEDGWAARVRVAAVEQSGGAVSGPDRAWLRLRGGPPPPPERRLRVRGHFSRRPAYLNLHLSPPGEWGMNVKSRRLIAGLGKAPPGPLRAVVQLRQRLLDLVTAADRPGAVLAQALVFGDSRRVPPEWKTGLRRSGLSHLLAVSGLHVGLVLGGFWWLCGGVSNRWTALGGVAVLLAYACLVGPRPSLMRAGAMALLVILALALERPPQAFNALCAALILILCFDPAAIGDLGFQLSFLATAGILVLAPRLLASWRQAAGRRLFPLAAGLAATLSAQLATLPVVAVEIGTLTPFAPIANLLFVPWTAVALALSMMWVAAAAAGALLGPCAAAGSPAATDPAAVVELAAAALLGLLDAISLPFASLADLPPGAWLALPTSVGFSAALALALWLGASFTSIRRAAYALALVMACTPATPDATARLAMLDVGQGEAILLKSGDRGPTILVDGGGFRRGNFAEAALLQALAAEGVYRIDLAVLSHGDTDHCRGLLDLARHLRIERLWAARVEVADGCGRDLANLLGDRVELVERGHEEQIGAFRLEVHHPGPSRTEGGNAASLVLRACVSEACALLVGDLDLAGERELLASSRRRQRSLRSEVLKVGHHGSRTSTGAPLLAAVAPRLALVSAGRRNSYGHPAPDVVSRIEARGVRLLRTDRHGRIEVRFRRDAEGRVRPFVQVAAWPRRGAKPSP